MPRRSEGVTIGFLGTGEMKVDPATTVIEEYLNSAASPDDPVRFVFPLTSEEFSDSMHELVTMAQASKIAYEVVSTGSITKRAMIEVSQSATKTYTVPDIWTQMEAILVDALPKSTLMVLWDDEREELNDIAGRFIDAGIEVRDLKAGGHVLAFEETGTQEEPEPEDEDEDDEEAEQPEDEAEEEEVPAATAELTHAHTRAQLEKLSHADVKDIATGMGLAPRKARENMIQAILEAEDSPEATTQGPATPGRGTEALGATPTTLVDLEALQGVLGGFTANLIDGLDLWATHFLQGLEGVAFNLTPPEPAKPDEEDRPAPARRLAR